MPHKEKLAVQYRIWGVLGFEGIGSDNKGLFAKIYSFLSDVVEDGGLLPISQCVDREFVTY